MGQIYTVRISRREYSTIFELLVIVWELGNKKKWRWFSKRFEAKIWLGGYDTHENLRLSTGGWGVPAWPDPGVGGNGKKILFV
jgi:hypothetical protein